MDQVGRGGEHGGRLALPEILLQGVGKFPTVLDKLPLSLLKCVLPLGGEKHLENSVLLELLGGHLGSWDVGRNLIHSVKKLLDGAGNLLDSLKESFSISDLVRNPGQNLLQVCTLPVQLLERLLRPAAPVLQAVLVTDPALQPQHGLVHVDAEVSLVHQPHDQVVGEARVCIIHL